MGDVRVHRGSPEPTRIGALAYAQGRDIHLASGQDRHLPHEAWHVVQQAQGRVAQTRQAMGVALNDDPGLEAEADRMGQRALSAGTTQMMPGSEPPKFTSPPIQQKPVIQRLAGFEIELRVPFYGSAEGVATDNDTFLSDAAQQLDPSARKQVVDFLYGGNKYSVSYGKVDDQYDISADHSPWRSPHEDLLAHIEAYHLAKQGAQPTMANPEYRTVPLEERDPASQEKMATIAGAIQNHAKESIARAKRGQTNALSAPVQDQMTGIPVPALQSLLQGDAEGTALMKRMIRKLKPSLYYQTTVGTLPSEIPTLFEESAADIQEKNPDSAKIGLLLNSVARVDAAFNTAILAPFLGAMDPGHKASLRGWLTLVAQYLLADQIEVSSTRYKMTTIDGEQRLIAKGGTEKNLVAYLSKTDLRSSVAALPPAVRPSPHAGPNAENWHNLFQALVTNCHPNNFDLIAELGLVNYEGQELYNEKGVKIGTVQHGDVFGGADPKIWIYHLMHDLKGGEYHVRSGNELSLDDKQEELAPELSIRGEQAIPLEDRAASRKASLGSLRDFDGTSDRIMDAWNSAVDRRFASTADRTRYLEAYDAVSNALRPQFDALGSLPTIHGQLRRMRAQLDALANPDNLQKSHVLLQELDLEFKAWRAKNSNPHLALLKLILLIENRGWDRKTIRGKPPTGVGLMRAELAARHKDNATLTNLQKIANDRLAAGGRTRRAATGHLYRLVRDTPRWIGTGAGWTNFVAQYNRTNGAV